MSFISSFVVQRLQALELAAMPAQAVTWAQHSTASIDRAARIAVSLEPHGQLQAMAAAVADDRPHVLAGEQLRAAESPPLLMIVASPAARLSGPATAEPSS